MEDWALPTIDRERCTACGLCVTSAVELIENRPVIVRPKDCAYCGVCEDMCPEGAIALSYVVVSANDDALPPGDITRDRSEG